MVDPSGLKLVDFYSVKNGYGGVSYSNNETDQEEETNSIRQFFDSFIDWL